MRTIVINSTVTPKTARDLVPVADAAGRQDHRRDREWRRPEA
jgi:hypothetical protein